MSVCTGRTMKASPASRALTIAVLILAIISTKQVVGLEPSFDVPIVNVSVIAGQDAMLPCSVGDLGDHQVVWSGENSMTLTLQDRIIVDDPRFTIIHRFLKEWTLMIRDVQWTDRGQYHCIVNTQPPISKVVQLHVRVPAQIIDHLSSDDVTAREGDDVILVCNATGVPPPKVTWYRQPAATMAEGGSTRESKMCKHGSGLGGEIANVEGEILLIQNISRYCDSYYLCEASNDILPKVTRQMKVTVVYPPEIHMRNQRQGQQLGRETILECHVSASPLGATTWQRNGKDVSAQMGKYDLDAYDIGPNTVALSLRIARVSKRDYGEYTCVAENRLGVGKASMQLVETPVKAKLKHHTTVPILKIDTNTLMPRGHAIAESTYRNRQASPHRTIAPPSERVDERNGSQSGPWCQTALLMSIILTNLLTYLIHDSS